MIPLSTKSLIGDGMYSMASNMSMMGTHVVTAGKEFVKQQGKKFAGRAFHGTKESMNRFTGKLQQTRARLQRKWRERKDQS